MFEAKTPAGRSLLDILTQMTQPPAGMPLQDADVPSQVYGYPVRAPYPGELTYFSSNPHVSGMAGEDNHIVLNPFSALKSHEKLSVAQNEAARLFLRGQANPLAFDVTPDQQQRFAGTVYGDPKNAEALKQTLLGRFFSGDPSAGQPTSQQQEFVDWLRQQLEGRQ